MNDRLDDHASPDYSCVRTEVHKEQFEGPEVTNWIWPRVELVVADDTLNHAGDQDLKTAFVH